MSSRMPTHRRWSGAVLVLGLVLATCTEEPRETATSNAPEVSSPVAASTAAADQLLLASAKVALPPAAVRLEDLPDAQSAGAMDLQTYCTTCHAIPSPAMHSATDWPGVVRRMWLRMDLIDPQYTIPVPELGERIVILDYLMANALKVTRENLPDAPGRALFDATCSRCHELPDPRQHPAQDWLVVVRRMNQHMKDILGKELTPPQVDEIVRYLGTVTT